MHPYPARKLCSDLEMLFARIFQVLFAPTAGWEAVRNGGYGVTGVFLAHTVPFSALPVLAGWYGTTQVGWEIGAAGVVRLSTQSATDIAVLYYLALLVAVVSVAWVIRWMSVTYGASPTLGQCLALASLSATPLFVAGLMQLYPVLWLNLLVGLPALAYTMFLFFTGVPTVMQISVERAFLFSCAVLAFGLVTLVSLLAVTALLWGAGFAPAFAAA